MMKKEMYDIIDSMGRMRVTSNANNGYMPQSRLESLIETCIRQGRILEKEKNCGAFLNLLWHVSICREDSCQFVPCCHLKGSVQHVKNCQNNSGSECEECLTVVSIFCLHIDGCTSNSCPIPFCREVRSKPVFKLLQAQLMK